MGHGSAAGRDELQADSVYDSESIDPLLCGAVQCSRAV